MGGTAEQGDGLSDNVFPVHKVTVDDFYMCRFEVTQELFSYVIGKWYKWSYADGMYADYPADKRKMSEIKTFCDNLSKLTGKRLIFDLPTEAEWEFAARGGRKRVSTMFAGSDDFSKVGNCFRTSEHLISGSAYESGETGPGKKREKRGRKAIGIVPQVWSA